MNRFFLLSLILLCSAGLASCGSENYTPRPETQDTDTPDTWKPGDGWNLVWSDEFSGENLSSANWNYDLGYGDNAANYQVGWGNHELQKYTSNINNIRLENGKLIIRAEYLGGGPTFRKYTSARINTRAKQEFKYGKIAARMKLTQGQGLWPAFWMLGQNQLKARWPRCGEIDIMESGKNGVHTRVGAALHWMNAQENAPWPDYWSHTDGDMMLPTGESFSADYHVFELIWDNEKMQWFTDGIQFFEYDITPADMSEFHQKFFIILNLAVGGMQTSYTGKKRPDINSFPQSMFVDWVRVYQRK